MLKFQMMAGAGDTIPFEVVVKSLYHVTQKMDEKLKRALLMCTDRDEVERVLDYAQFSSLLLNIVAAGSLDFHDVANSMTLSFCKNDVSRTDLSDFFLSDDTHRAVVADTDHTNIIDALQDGRMNRLFDLWDADHSGDLDFEEVVLGFSTLHSFPLASEPLFCCT